MELHGIVGPKSLLKFCAYVIVHIRKFSINGRRFPSARQAVGQSMSVEINMPKLKRTCKAANLGQYAVKVKIILSSPKLISDKKMTTEAIIGQKHWYSHSVLGFTLTKS